MRNVLSTLSLLLGLLLGLGLLDSSAPSLAAAQEAVQQRVVPSGQGTGAIAQTRIVPARPDQKVRQDLKRAVHRRGVRVEVPELDPTLGAQGLCLALGMTLLMRERRKLPVAPARS